MKISLLAVGRMKNGPEKMLADDYLTRASGLGRKAGITQLKVTETGESQAATAQLRMAEEAQFFTRSAAPASFMVLLDERGKQIASTGLADLLQRQADSGTPDLCFLIGGPDGIDPSLKERAGLLLSLGVMTWPHRLARVMLLEQIYRAVTIMVNHPYHRP